MSEHLLAAQLIDILKSRSEIRTAETDELEVLHITLHVIFTGDHIILLGPGITLDNVYIHLSEKIVLIHQNRKCLLQETPYIFTGTGFRCINDNGQLLHLTDFLILKCLDQGHIAVMIQTVCIINIIITVQIQSYFFSKRCKFLKKTFVIITFSCSYFNIVIKVSSHLSRVFRTGLHIRAHLLTDLLPLFLPLLTLLLFLFLLPVIVLIILVIVLIILIVLVVLILVIPAVAILLVLLLRIPENMIVHHKLPLRRFHFKPGQRPFRQRLVNTFRCQHLHL